MALAAVTPARAQELGGAGTILGTIKDPTGGVLRAATVTLSNPVSGLRRETTTDEMGRFTFRNLPPNPYHVTVAVQGFQTLARDVDVRSAVPITLELTLNLAATTQSVEVIGTVDLLEANPSAHTDVDQSLVEKLPLEAVGGLNQAITLAAPGVVADSNGFFHPQGDHAEVSYSVDNQPVSDQQSKAFSTQLPPSAIQSLEIITGATPAEFGDKTSLVVNAITKSGLNQKKPTGNITFTYGTFGTVNQETSLAYGNAKAGNFVDFNFDRSGRFLDAPEFTVLHDRGTSFNLFDRFDYALSPKDTFHVNLFLARNKFQQPNTFDQQALGQDQHQLVHSLNIAPGLVHVFNPHTILTINPYYRLDIVKYFPSANPFSDETTTINQQRRLNNVGVKADVAYVNGIHNAKFGVQLSHTFLTENFQFGITDPNFNDPASPDFLPGLLQFDLTRGGHLFNFHGHTDIKQEAAYAQDNITLHNLTLNLGLRFDNYDGISHDHSFQPRLGASYLVKRTNTVLRASYTHNFETPYNENLILSSATGAGGLADGVLGSAISQPLKPGRRNQFDVGFQQGFGKLVVFDIDYFNKRTTN
ncbi:MAG: TonB-dependent receptor, partial [Acidobacteria bacterium]